MIIAEFLVIDAQTLHADRGRVLDLATEAAQRAYYRATSSRRATFIWSWTTDGWLADGSGVNLHGTLCGNRGRGRRSDTGYPVLAECWIYVRSKGG